VLARDRVTEVWVRGLRSLADVHLPLRGLSVLIGENGAGKSSLVETFEILRKVGGPTPLLSALIRLHDLDGIMREDAQRIEFGVSIEGSGEPRLDYRFVIERRGKGGFAVGRERLDVHVAGHAEPLHAILRGPTRCRYFNQSAGRLDELGVSPDQLALRALLDQRGKQEQAAASRVSDVLASGAVHLPFEVRARWLCEERKWDSPLRQPAVVERAVGVERLGVNLVNAYAALRNRTDWQETLDDIRLGLGADIRDVLTEPALRGQLELRVRYADAGDVPAAGLSDGTLCYLAFVALVRFGPEGGFLVIDEPESHLDPGLLVRVVDMLGVLAQTTPVVIATHSDRLLDALPDPCASVLLCELSAGRRTRLRRPDGLGLAQWLVGYRGLGHLRAEAPLALVMGDPLPPRAPDDDDEP